jgi:hypothetical protein
MTSIAVIEALAVTAELTNTQLSPAAARVMAADLAPYPDAQVLGALSRCRKELKGKLTVADVVSRLDDGRPGPEEAWALLPFDERQTVCWTEEMEGAWGVALPLIEEGDRIAARMAFLESYRRRVQSARDAAARVKWRISFGQDPEVRQQAIAQAVQLGRISETRAMQLGYTPPAHLAPPQAIQDLAKRITDRSSE